MMKRSNIEIQIRNILSEILIRSLKCGEESSLIYLMFRFCQFIEETGKSTVRLTDLLRRQEDMGWVRLDWGEILENLSSLHIFEMNSENCLQIERRFKNSLSDICIKVEMYWKFISDLYSKEEKFKDGIEGEIKKGILLFNKGFYFECHEFLEEVWRKENGNEKSFLQGLIHFAVALYHMEYKNYEGATSYLNRGYRRLKEFEPVFLGVDIETLLVDIRDYLGLLERSNYDSLKLLKSAVPKIRLIE
jgi:uncharacterized protein